MSELFSLCTVKKDLRNFLVNTTIRIIQCFVIVHACKVCLVYNCCLFVCISIFLLPVLNKDVHIINRSGAE